MIYTGEITQTCQNHTRQKSFIWVAQFNFSTCLFRQDSFEKFEMKKRIPNRTNASVTLQSVAEEGNSGYKPLIQDEDGTLISHHRKKRSKEVCEFREKWLRNLQWFFTPPYYSTFFADYLDQKIFLKNHNFSSKNRPKKGWQL